MDDIVHLPPHLYTLIGALILTNVGTVGTLIIFIFRCGVFVANTKTGIENAQQSASLAHKRIDKILLPSNR